MASEDGWTVYSSRRHGNRQTQLKHSKRPAAGGSANATTPTPRATYSLLAQDEDNETKHEVFQETDATGHLHWLATTDSSRAANTHPHKKRPKAPERSTANLSSQFAECMKSWQACSERAVIAKLLETRLDHAARRVRRAVCLGLGSLSAPLRDEMRQLCFWVDAVAMLAHKTGHEIELIAQDPAFNNADVEFLSSQNILCLQSPRGIHMIGNDAFLYAPHFPLSMWTVEIRTGDAPIVIGNNIKDLLQLPLSIPDSVAMQRALDEASADPNSAFHERLKSDVDMKRELERFLQAYEAVEFPLSDRWGNEAFAHTTIYYQQEKDADTEE